MGFLELHCSNSLSKSVTHCWMLLARVPTHAWQLLFVLHIIVYPSQYFLLLPGNQPSKRILELVAYVFEEQRNGLKRGGSLTMVAMATVTT